VNRYTPGQINKFFNKKILDESVLRGIVTASVIFFVSYLSLSNGTSLGRMSQIDLQSFGFLIGTIIMIVVNLENALEIWYWTKLYHISLWGTIILYFLFHLALYSTYISKIFGKNYTYVGVAILVLANGNFWFILLLSCVILLLPVFCRE
jgi:magnesium-transporting ATPase (P-type)